MISSLFKAAGKQQKLWKAESVKRSINNYTEANGGEKQIEKQMGRRQNSMVAADKKKLEN